MKVQLPDGQEKTLHGDTVLYALGMKAVPSQELADAARAAGIRVQVIGDAIKPGKVDQATRTAYLAAVSIAAAEELSAEA